VYFIGLFYAPFLSGSRLSFASLLQSVAGTVHSLTFLSAVSNDFLFSGNNPLLFFFKNNFTGNRGNVSFNDIIRYLLNSYNLSVGIIKTDKTK